MPRSKGAGYRHKAGTGRRKTASRIKVAAAPNPNKANKDDDDGTNMKKKAAASTTEESASTMQQKQISLGMAMADAVFDAAKTEFIQKQNTRLNELVSKSANCPSVVPTTTDTATDDTGTATTITAGQLVPVPPSEPASPNRGLERRRLFNNQPIDLVSTAGVLPATGIYEPFRYNKKGERRSDGAQRKMKSRSAKKIVTAVTSLPEADRTAALELALVHPDIRANAKELSFLPNDAVAIHSLEQQRKMVERAFATPKKRGRSTDDRASFVQSILVGMAPSPESEKKPSKRARISAMGIPYATGYRLLAKADEKRKRLMENVEGLSWASVKKRKGFSKVTPEIRKNLVKWILEHPHIIQSPLVSDTLMIFNPETGQKERTNKLLCEVSIRELHNDMIAPVAEGGLAEAHDSSGNVRISDSALRYLLPSQIRRMTARHKQMCGCEACLTISSLQQSLNAWRLRRLRELTYTASEMRVSRAKRAATERAETYRNVVLPNGNTWHSKPKFALSEVMCELVAPTGHPHWKCVTRKCEQCPTYPIPLEENKPGENDPTIRFHVYNLITSCTQHGVLELRAKVCERCEEAIRVGTTKSGKVRTRKHLCLLVRPIGQFIKDYYLVALERYAYHRPHVLILSKMGCGLKRQMAFESMAGSIKTRRDYAERLSAKFNLEIQSDHFGNGRSLSIEGSSIEAFSSHAIRHGLVDKNHISMQFHSHFADDSRQDAATTCAHTIVMLDKLKNNGEIGRNNPTMWEETDGCGKQYRCAKAFWLLSYLAVKYGMTIDRAIGAPGHGKDIVDGLNATDKAYLGGCMCLIGTPEANNGEKRMAAESMTETASKSLAFECARLCSISSRINGVKGDAKSAKRESEAKIKRRHYHVQDPNIVHFKHSKFETVGLPKGLGVMACYNVRADKDLGLGKVALRRIPCACDACIRQLNAPWIPGVPINEQTRYAQAGSLDCEWGPIFLNGLNNWHIVTLRKTKLTDTAEIEEAQALVLEGIGVRMAERVQIGGNGAFLTDDPDADGYYIVEWSGPAYTLQEEIILAEFDPPISVPMGELVVAAKYWNPVPRARLWYTPGENLATVVRMKQVLSADLSLGPISEACPLPNNCDKRVATRLGAKQVRNADHEELLEEIQRRVALDYDEDESEAEEESSDNTSDSSSSDDDSE
jgi:hypothetical protein